ncbi:MAG: serine hydroxymethyltransferase [Euryarchaeota archaeon]|nr:serine hydroxymethyltransferase [Euryarchaeota archaeon]
MQFKKIAEDVQNLVKTHHEWMDTTLNMIASENITSPAVRKVIASDFSHRYAEGEPRDRLYQGCKYIDEVELIAINLAKKLFDAEHVNVKPVSGAVANLALFTALTKPGDTIMALSVPSGAHISTAKFGAAGVRGLNVESIPFNQKGMTVDVDGMIKKIRDIKPKLILFGGSIFLFPHPVKEARTVADEIGAYVGYDAAHVFGLIAGKQFQDPLREGADAISSSRHKTFPGPQGGLILCKQNLAKKIDNAVFPGLVSNHHLHHIAGLAITLAEMLEFGEAYAKQIIKNAKTLAEELHNSGLNVLCADKGFTASHQVVIDVLKNGGGGQIAKTLEEANIIVNKNLLPWDSIDHAKNPSGIRLGVQELTRLGMKEGEMAKVAELIKRIVLDKENPLKVRSEVIKFRQNFKKVHYCFDSALEAYRYAELKLG